MKGANEGRPVDWVKNSMMNLFLQMGVVVL